MELFILVSVFLLSWIIMAIIRNRIMDYSTSQLPPYLPSLPLIGSLPFLGGFGHLGKFFMKKSEKLGPIFTFKIGQRLCLVLNSSEVIHEALIRNNFAFAGREPIGVECLGANKERKGIIFTNFNETWRKYQQLSLSILKEFGFGDKRIMESRILAEVEALVAFIRRKRNEAFNPIELMSQATSNIILNISLGCRDDYERGICDMAALSEKAVQLMDPVFDFAPFLRFFPYFKQKFNDYCITTEKLIKAIDEYIKGMDLNGTECFVRRYLEKEGPDYDHKQLLFTIRDFSNAGTTTTAATLCWTFVFLANHPEVQKRVQQEIDAEVSRDRLPNLDDKSKLPYVEATILEILRYRTLVPLAVPHLTIKDCKVGGYLIPTRTVVVPNLYAAHMDPEQWKDPEVFRPERFLNESGEVINRESVITFSLGRRSCLGEELARQELFLFLTGLYQNYNIIPPANQERIDVTEAVAITVEARPYKIRMISRRRRLSSLTALGL